MSKQEHINNISQLEALPEDSIHANDVDLSPDAIAAFLLKLSELLKTLGLEQDQVIKVVQNPQLSDFLNILNTLNIDQDAQLMACLTFFSELEINQDRLAKNIDRELLALYKKIAAVQSISSLGIYNQPVLSESNKDTKEAKENHDLSVENLRRMLLAMIDDVRVVLIKLAQILVHLRYLKNESDEQKKLAARRVFDIYAPLANRLGVWQLKWELEDIAFHYMYREQYYEIAHYIDEKRLAREQYIKSFLATLNEKLEGQQLKAEVSGRPKHIYSIWRKMQKKNLKYEEIYDIRAVRILVDSVAQCYTALGVVHTCWSNVGGEFDDYIAVPKENNYRSIHTAIFGPEGRVIEVQIRTHDMHQENELGVAAHWRYKESVGSNRSLDQKILWLRQLLEWKDELSSNEIIDEFNYQVDEERIYVFSPTGQVVDLPTGSTPIDFAYAIHTEVGHRCRGAKVNKRIVPLTYKLETGDQVEILTVKKGGPSRDWLNQNIGYVRTNRARNRIIHWFREENRDSNISDGRHIFERELSRLATTDVSFEQIASKLGYKQVDDMFAGLGNGDLKVAQLVNPIRQLTQTEVATPIIDKPSKNSRRKNNQSNKDDVKIYGVGNMLTSMAQCCHPLPGDQIIGYITIGRGVTVHRKDCNNMLRLRDDMRNRLIKVDWESHGGEGHNYSVNISIMAYDRSGLLHDITSIFKEEKCNVIGLSSKTDKSRNETHIVVNLEITDIGTLSKVLNRVEGIPNIINAQRQK